MTRRCQLAAFPVPLPSFAIAEANFAKAVSTRAVRFCFKPRKVRWRTTSAKIFFCSASAATRRPAKVRIRLRSVSDPIKPAARAQFHAARQSPAKPGTPSPTSSRSRSAHFGAPDFATSMISRSNFSIGSFRPDKYSASALICCNASIIADCGTSLSPRLSATFCTAACQGKSRPPAIPSSCFLTAKASTSCAFSRLVANASSKRSQSPRKKTASRSTP